MGEGYIHKSEDQTARGVFVNLYTHYLDSKKRLTIPSVWREMAGEPRQLFVLQSVSDQCLSVYPAHELARRVERLRNLSIADEQSRQFARALAFRAELVPWDAQGRIRVKDELLEYAGLINEVLLSGTFDGFELWSPDRWKQRLQDVRREELAKFARSAGF